MLSSLAKISLFSQDAHTGIAALRGHGCDHLPTVDDGVVTLDAAEQRVPIVPAGSQKTMSVL